MGDDIVSKPGVLSRSGSYDHVYPAGKIKSLALFVVIAGNKKQFIDWVKQWGYAGDMRRRKSDFTYVHDPNHLRGLNAGHKIIFVGTYWENPAYKSGELESVLRMSGARPLVFGDDDHYKHVRALESNLALLKNFVGLCLPFAMRYLSDKSTPAKTLLRQVWDELFSRGILPAELDPVDRGGSRDQLPSP